MSFGNQKPQIETWKRSYHVKQMSSRSEVSMLEKWHWSQPITVSLHSELPYYLYVFYVD